MWLQPAPVDERMVVSEIGEQWSPKTEPASVAASATVASFRSPAGSMTTMTMGIRMPKVPHAVPVEKESSAATTKMMAGRK